MSSSVLDPVPTYDETGIIGELRATRVILHALLREMSVHGREGAVDNVYRIATEELAAIHRRALQNVRTEERRRIAEEVREASDSALDSIIAPTD